MIVNNDTICHSMALICSLTNTLLRDELRILSKLQAFAGNLLCDAALINWSSL